MDQQPTTDRHAARVGILKIVSQEALILLITFVCAIVLVAFLSFATPTIEVTQFAALDPTTYLNAVRDYLLGLLQGNLGETRYHQPVFDVLLTATQRSAILIGVSLLVAVPLGLAWGGALATVRRGSLAAFLFGLSTLAISLPTFAVLILAMEAVSTVTLRTGIRLAYISGYGLDSHLILPVAALVLRGSAYMARSFQVAQQDILRQDWIRTARAKGFDGLLLWSHHILPALTLPLIGNTLGVLRIMVGGLIIVEYITSWGGLGSTMLSVGGSGLRPTEGQVAASAAGVFILFFIFVDRFAQILVYWIDRRRTG